MSSYHILNILYNIHILYTVYVDIYIYIYMTVYIYINNTILIIYNNKYIYIYIYNIYIVHTSRFATVDSPK